MRYIFQKEWVKFLFASLVLVCLPILFYHTQVKQYNFLWLSVLSVSTVVGFILSWYKSTMSNIYNLYVLLLGFLHFVFYYNVVWMQGLDLFNLMYFVILTFVQVLLYSELKFSYYTQVISYAIPLSLIFLVQKNAFDKPYVWLFLDALIKTIALFLTYFSIKTQEIQKMLDYKSRYVNKIREDEEDLRKDLDDSYRTLFKNKSKFQTKKLEWQEELEKRLKFQEMDYHKEAFLEQINHTLKNNANSIFGISDILMEKLSDKESRYLLKSLKHNTYDVLSTINSIMEFVAVDGKKLTIVSKPQSFQKIEKSIEALVQVQAKRHNKKFGFISDPSIPQFLEYDFDRLNKVIKLLIGAIAEWTEENQIKIKIEQLEQKYEDEYLLRFEFIIHSNQLSEGYIEELLNKEKQFQNIIHSIKSRNYANKDYNFLIADAIVRLLKSDKGLQFEMLDQYSIVYFDLGFKKLPLVEEIKLKKVSHQRRDNKFEDLLILLVEDNKTNQIVAKLMLENLGSKVVVANDGQEALKVYQEMKDDISLILMDIQMPVLDGISATSELRSKYGEKPIIVALTATNLDGEDKHYSLLGFDAFIGKPIEKVKLVDTIGQILLD